MDVARFVLRRILISIPVLILASFLTFIVAVNTGDPLASLRTNPKIPRAVIRQEEIRLHLNDSTVHRYQIWVSGFVHGDLGLTVQGQKVAPELFHALGVTVRMIALAALLSVIFGVIVGVVSAVRQYSAVDYLTTGASFLFYSIPVVWLAGLLKIVGIKVNESAHHTYFYTLGETTPNLTGGFFSHMGTTLGHLYLPVITLTLIEIASLSRYQRATMLDVLGSDYIRLARAKGLSPRRVLLRHSLRNALIPIVTIIALDLAAFFNGAVGTETVFGWRGMGLELVQSVRSADVNLLLGWLMITAVIVIAANLVADILYGVLDPRIRA
ncbi:MAG TPA: ABC transporter permease [Acidimicrobiales bacterium]|nr:ABC transporter permease [Acidimicrobiales bacterium]